MPSREPAIPVEVLREAAHRRVLETSLRAAAKEIGLSLSGLDHFLNDEEKAENARLRAQVKTLIAESERYAVERARLREQNKGLQTLGDALNRVRAERDRLREALLLIRSHARRALKEEEGSGGWPQDSDFDDERGVRGTG